MRGRQRRPGRAFEQLVIGLRDLQAAFSELGQAQMEITPQ
jgi:hypothetical protein